MLTLSAMLSIWRLMVAGMKLTKWNLFFCCKLVTYSHHCRTDRRCRCRSDWPVTSKPSLPESNVERDDHGSCCFVKGRGTLFKHTARIMVDFFSGPGGRAKVMAELKEVQLALGEMLSSTGRNSSNFS